MKSLRFVVVAVALTSGLSACGGSAATCSPAKSVAGQTDLQLRRQAGLEDPNIGGPQQRWPCIPQKTVAKITAAGRNFTPQLQDYFEHNNTYFPPVASQEARDCAAQKIGFGRLPASNLTYYVMNLEDRQAAATQLLTGYLNDCVAAETFVGQAEAVCATYNARINAVPKPTSVSELSSYIHQVTPLFREAVGKLEAIRAPGAKSVAYNQYVSTLNQEASTLDRAGQVANSDPRQAVNLIVDAQHKLSAQERQDAVNAGLRRCASGS
jgi:hypothetical protein